MRALNSHAAGVDPRPSRSRRRADCDQTDSHRPRQFNSCSCADRGAAGLRSAADLPHAPRPAGGDKRKGLTEQDYARFLDAAHQQRGGPLVLVWDGLNTHVSRAMRELVAADGLPTPRLRAGTEPGRDVVVSVRAA
jgi:hypothetical protein